MLPNEILSSWAEFTGYDPKQTHFRGLRSIDLHEKNKIIAKISKYDNTGNLAVLYAKSVCKELLSDMAPTSYMDLLNDPSYFNTVKKMWGAFNDTSVVLAEGRFKEIINNVIDKITDGRLIGGKKTEISIDKMLDTLTVCINSIEKCKPDIYAQGEPSGQKVRFSTHIHVFNGAEDCILALNKAKDAIYLCYIKLNDSAYGYFGFFVKDGNSIYSISERIDESYPGEHSHRRNCRDAENKQYDLFPYDFIFNFAEHDYKGYASKHIIDEEKLDIFNLGADAYLPLVVAMYLVSAANWGKVPKGKLSYLFSIAMKTKVSELGTGSSLIPISDTALSSSYIKNPLINFEKDKFLKGEYSKQFDYSSREEHESCYDNGVFINERQFFVDLYGQDFDMSYLSIEDIHTKLLASPGNKGEQGNNDRTLEEDMYKSEFIGSQKRMELMHYWYARKALAKYIKGQLDKELESFGGVQGVAEWYRKAVNANLYKIVHAIARICDSQDKKDNDTLFNILKKRMEIQNEHYPRGHNYCSSAIILNQHEPDDRWKLLCPVTHTPVSFCFTFMPEKWEEVRDVLGLTDEAIPKILKGWTVRHDWEGNSNIDMVDPVSMIQHPLSESFGMNCHNATAYDFSFGIGFSKRGFMAVCNDVGIQPKKFWIAEERKGKEK